MIMEFVKQKYLSGERALFQSNGVRIEDSIFADGESPLKERYTHHIDMRECIIEAPKTFRRASDITLKNVDMPFAQESFWNCHDIRLNKVSARGDYFGMSSENIIIDDLHLTGNYCFDGAKNIEVHNAKLISKDAFWNCENVIVSHIDSITNPISGVIRAHSIGEIILDETKINPQDTKIMITNPIVGDSYQCDYVNC